MMATLSGPCVIGGDWQCTPDELRSTGWLKIVRGVIYAPEAPTCGERVMDYFVVCEGLSQTSVIVDACVIGDQTFGPHSLVRLMVKANTRTVMVRQPKVPIGFRADLPFGPMPQTGSPRVLCGNELGLSSSVGDRLNQTQHDVISDVVPGDVAKDHSLSCNGGCDNFDNGDMRSLADLGRDYNDLINAMEDELCAVEGLEGIQAKAKKGRSTGAHFCWKPAAGDDTTGAAKTTSASRGWRRTAK